MAKPFESDDGDYLVLWNEEGQHSLWPAALDVPAGWEVVKAADSRPACLEYVENSWTDMRPTSLVSAVEAATR